MKTPGSAESLPFSEMEGERGNSGQQLFGVVDEILSETNYL